MLALPGRYREGEDAAGTDQDADRARRSAGIRDLRQIGHGSEDPRDDCGADAAAYVLGALEPDEAGAFRATSRPARSAATRSARSVRSSTRCRSARRRTRRRGRSSGRVMADRRRPRPAARRAAAGRAGRARWSFVPPPGVRGSRRRRWSRVPRSSSACVRRLGSEHAGHPRQHGWAGATASLRITGGHGGAGRRADAGTAPGQGLRGVARRGRAGPDPDQRAVHVTSSGGAEVDVPGQPARREPGDGHPEPAGGSRVPTHAAGAWSRTSRRASAGRRSRRAGRWRADQRQRAPRACRDLRAGASSGPMCPTPSSTVEAVQLRQHLGDPAGVGGRRQPVALAGDHGRRHREVGQRVVEVHLRHRDPDVGADVGRCGQQHPLEEGDLRRARRPGRTRRSG